MIQFLEALTVAQGFFIMYSIVILLAVPIIIHGVKHEIRKRKLVRLLVK
jgi:hypothetical protein